MSDNNVSRRQFLKTSSGAAAGAAAAASGVVSLTFSVEAWAAELNSFNAHEAKTLLQVARQIFPHPSLGDMYYAVVVDDLDADAAKDKAAGDALKQGVKELDEAKSVPWNELSDGYQLEVLESMQDAAIFQMVKGKAIVSIYNNPLVWRELGYEGASAQYGGYINRGFDDLRWLSNPPEDASPKAG
jgi:hypothetical protein